LRVDGQYAARIYLCLQQIKTIRQHAYKVTNRLFDESDVNCEKRRESEGKGEEDTENKF
jgi:hypothetical protein